MVPNLMEQCCIDNNRSITMETILIGDFNTNIDRYNNNNVLTRKLKEFSDTCNFTQLIQDYTRVTDNSKTTIDLILASDYTNISQSCVIDIGLSDHCMIYCTRKLKRDYIGKHNNVTFRSMKGYSKAEFGAWNRFKTVFVNIIDTLAPMKRVRLKQRSEPWFDHYNCVIQGKTCSSKGGLMMYIHEKFNYKVKTYGNLCNNWESQIVELSGGGLSKPITICNIYRPPSDLNENYKRFIDELSSLLRIKKK